METLAQRLRYLRTKEGFSVSDVARKIDVSKSTYREWELGREIRGEPYDKLAKVFNESLGFILTGQRSSIEEELLKIEEAVKNIRMRL